MTDLLKDMLTSDLQNCHLFCGS